MIVLLFYYYFFFSSISFIAINFFTFFGLLSFDTTEIYSKRSNPNLIRKYANTEFVHVFITRKINIHTAHKAATSANVNVPHFSTLYSSLSFQLHFFFFSEGLWTFKNNHGFHSYVFHSCRQGTSFSGFFIMNLAIYEIVISIGVNRNLVRNFLARSKLIMS